MVEMAFVAPLLIFLLLGMIEFGFIFGQFNEVRHAAREGARVAAVSNTDFDQDSDGDFDATDIRLYTCSVLNLDPGNGTIAITQTGTAIGSTATVSVTVATPSLSGAPIISSILPTSVSNVATFVLEQPASWSGAAGTC